MDVTRGEFLSAVTAAVLGAVTLPEQLQAGGAAKSPAPFSADLFRGLTGTSFAVSGPGRRTTDLVLADVAEPAVSDARTNAGVEQFTLGFLSANGDALGDGTYAVSHKALGTFELFVVRGPNGRAGYTFSASFALLKR